MALYASIYNGPPRHYGSTRTDKRYIAIHNTSNDATAEGEASYAKRREDSVSSHYYVDNDSIVQSLDTALRAFHAGSSIGNSQAISYEITGTNGKSRQWWLDNVAWPLLARQIRIDCVEHDIVPRLLTVEQIKAGNVTGIITHDQMRLAWGGTTHTDPGANFPLDHLLALVQAEMEVGMSATSEAQVASLHTATFKGGSSCGKPVLEEYRDPKDGSAASNSIIEQLGELRGELAKVRATPPGSFDPAVFEEMLRRVVREELDKTKLGSS
jgi:N-acetyl-anhydromuramyl-L-alanine amidase AmpD